MEKDGSVVASIAGTTVWLLPSKALFIPDQAALCIADPHFGKADHFRKAGIPVPNGTDATNYAQLERLLNSLPVQSVYFLGDLFHSDHNQAWETFSCWLSSYDQVDFWLIKGNHDILPNKAYQDAGLKVGESPFALPPFQLSHEPFQAPLEEATNLCGHIHPAVKLRGGARQRLKLPCFYHTRNQLILPAFGQFTGTAFVEPVDGEDVYPVGEGQVFAF